MPRAVYDLYNGWIVKRLGCVQVALGAASVLMWCIALGVEAAETKDHLPKFTQSYAGIWGGGFVALTGLCGIASAKTKTTCRVKLYMVITIVAMLFFNFFYLIMASIGYESELHKPINMTRLEDTPLAANCSGHVLHNVTADNSTDVTGATTISMTTIPTDVIDVNLTAIVFPEFCYTNKHLINIYCVCWFLAFAFYPITIWASALTCCAVCRTTATVPAPPIRMVEQRAPVVVPPPEQQPFMQPGSAPSCPVQPPPQGYQQPMYPQGYQQPGYQQPGYPQGYQQPGYPPQGGYPAPYPPQPQPYEPPPPYTPADPGALPPQKGAPPAGPPAVPTAPLSDAAGAYAAGPSASAPSLDESAVKSSHHAPSLPDKPPF